MAACGSASLPDGYSACSWHAGQIPDLRLLNLANNRLRHLRVSACYSCLPAQQHDLRRVEAASVTPSHSLLRASHAAASAHLALPVACCWLVLRSSTKRSQCSRFLLPRIWTPWRRCPTCRTCACWRTRSASCPTTGEPGRLAARLPAAASESRALTPLDWHTGSTPCTAARMSRSSTSGRSSSRCCPPTCSRLGTCPCAPLQCRQHRQVTAPQAVEHRCPASGRKPAAQSVREQGVSDLCSHWQGMYWGTCWAGARGGQAAARHHCSCRQHFRAWGGHDRGRLSAYRRPGHARHAQSRL